MTAKGAYSGRQLCLLFSDRKELERFRAWAKAENLPTSQFVIDSVIAYHEVRKQRPKQANIMEDLVAIRSDNERLKEENKLLKLSLAQLENNLRTATSNAKKISSEIIVLFTEDANTPLYENTIIKKLKNFDKKEIYQQMAILQEQGIIEQIQNGKWQLDSSAFYSVKEYVKKE